MKTNKFFATAIVAFGLLVGTTSFAQTKEKTVEVPVKQKEQVFAMYAGVGISDNLQFNNFATEVEIGLQNKAGDIISAGYDTQKNISVKYSKQLFKIKK